MDGPAHTTGNVAAAISALTSAYEHAAALIAGLSDADEAFAHATALWAELRRATDANGQLRALLALRVTEENDLELAPLAERLSTPAFPLKKARAGQLVAAGRALRASLNAVSECPDTAVSGH